jgi:manganese/zinc/iron transport system ATP- binding protein
MNHYALDIENVTICYENELVLGDVNVQIPPKKLVGIIGPNGAGKSSLLKASLGIISPLTGNIRFFGQHLKKYQKKIAYLPQKDAIDWNFPITVFDVVLMGRYRGLFSLTSKEDKQKVMEALERVGLLPLAKRQINALSGGQKQRLFLARAYVQDADLYFLDEPFQGIDLSTEKMLVETLKEMKQNGKTLFVVHHDLFSLKDYFDTLIMLNRRVIATGETNSVLTEKNLARTFGHHPALFEEAFQAKIKQKTGQIVQ